MHGHIGGDQAPSPNMFSNCGWRTALPPSATHQRAMGWTGAGSKKPRVKKNLITAARIKAYTSFGKEQNPNHYT